MFYETGPAKAHIIFPEIRFIIAGAEFFSAIFIITSILKKEHFNQINGNYFWVYNCTKKKHSKRAEEKEKGIIRFFVVQKIFTR